jgi:hypothetical protein
MFERYILENSNTYHVQKFDNTSFVQYAVPSLDIPCLSLMLMFSRIINMTYT